MLLQFSKPMDPTRFAGTVRVRLKDGRDLVREIGAPDRCYTALPGVGAHKYAYFVWYSVGGDGR